MFCALPTEEFSSCGFFPKSVMTAIKPPLDLTFLRPAQRPMWQQCFMQHCTAAELNKKNAAVQVRSFIYSMGVEVERVSCTFTIQQDSAPKAVNTTFDQVIEMYGTCFTPEWMWSMSELLFYTCSQLSGENTEIYVRRLYELTEHTAFFLRTKTLQSEEISARITHDRVVWEIAAPASTHT